MMRVWTGLLTGFMLAGSALTAIADEDLPVVFEDDFEKGGQRWECMAASSKPNDCWRIEETDKGKSFHQFKNYGVSLSKHRSPFNIALAGDLVLRDFVFDADVKSTKKNYAHRDVCFYFGFRNPTHFHYIHFGLKTDKVSNRIMMVDDAPRVCIDEPDNKGTPWTDEWHHLRVTFESKTGTVTVYFDNMTKPHMKAEGVKFRWGRIGIGAFDDTSIWDNVKISGRIYKVDTAAVFDELKGWDWGSRPGGADTVLAMARKAGHDPAVRADLEKRLLQLVSDPAAKPAGKDFAFRLLRRLASDRAVSAMTRLLTDPNASAMAVYVLRVLPGTAATQALRHGVSRTKGSARIGVVRALGARRCAEAVEVIAPLLKDADTATARAAAQALGRIGTVQAAKALTDHLKLFRDDTEPGRLDLATACLEAAGRLLDAGRRQSAAAIFESVRKEPFDAVRTAVFLGSLQADPDRLVELLSTAEPAAGIKRLATQAIAATPGTNLTAGFVSALDELNGWAKSVVIEGLAERRDAGALPAVRKSLSDGEQCVRIAAMRGVAELGSEKDVGLLARFLEAGPAESEGAAQALTVLRGEDVAAKLAATLPKQAPNGKIAVMGILVERNATETAAAVAKQVESGNEEVREAAIAALGRLGGPAEVLLVLDEMDRSRALAAKSFLAILRRAGRTAAPALSKATETMTAANAGVLYDGWRILGGKGAADAANRGFSSSDPGIRTAAVRMLSTWRDPLAIPGLIELARNSVDKKYRILAVRGLLELAAQQNVNSATRAKLLDNVTPLVSRPEETNLLISALGKQQTVAALKKVAGFLGNDALMETAAATAYNMIVTGNLERRDAPYCRQVLEKVASATTNTRIETAARKRLEGEAPVVPPSLDASLDEETEDLSWL